MKQSRVVFLPKYLNKKRSPGLLFKAAILTWAFSIIFLLYALLSQPDKLSTPSLLLATIIPGLVVLILVGIIMRSKNNAINFDDSPGRAPDYQQTSDLQNEKKYFASVLSHDLRSPLSSIILLASYLKTKIENPETVQYIELIEQSARKELNMMTTLLSLMRADSINQDSVENVNLSEATESLIKDIEGRLSEKQIKTNLSISPDIRLFIDPQSLQLILNALFCYTLCCTKPGETLEVTAVDNETQVKVEIKFRSNSLDENGPYPVFSSANLIAKNGTKFPDHIDLYFCQKIISHYNGTIRVIADQEDCCLTLELDKSSPQTLANTL